jgi:hypothetical protein
MNGIWVYQYTNIETQLSYSLRKKFWELTLGIPDVAVKLYRMAQKEIIGHKGSPREEISIELLELVAKTRMGFAHKLLESMLRNPENAKAWDHPKNQLEITQESLRDDSNQSTPEQVRAPEANTNEPKVPKSEPAVPAPQGAHPLPIMDLRTLVSAE